MDETPCIMPARWQPLLKSLGKKGEFHDRQNNQCENSAPQCVWVGLGNDLKTLILGSSLGCQGTRAYQGPGKVKQRF